MGGERYDQAALAYLLTGEITLGRNGKPAGHHPALRDRKFPAMDPRTIRRPKRKRKRVR